MSGFPLYDLQDVPDKGKGLIAKVGISPGTCIIDEPPLFTTETLTNSDTIDKDLGAIVKSLDKQGQRAFLSLHNNFPGQPSPFSNIIRSNGYPLGPSSDVGGIFVETARINHSCLPNAQHAWNDKLKRMMVHAVRDIHPGDELTLSYIPGGPSSTRQSELKNYFGFQCKCELCSLPTDEKSTSDARFTKAQKLDTDIGTPSRVKQTPDRALADCKALLEIYETERIRDLRLPRLYYDAFQICAMHSDRARAASFAKLARRTRIVCEGVESVEGARLQTLADDPDSFENFGITKKWKTGLSRDGIAPGDKEYENWLWRK